MPDPVTRALTSETEARMRFSHWTDKAQHLRQQDDALQWAWGKLVNYGYHSLGMSYDEMAAIARKRRQTLYNRAAVHRAWPEAERVYQSLTWSHYEATYSLPEEWRRKLMDAAQEHGATVEQLREAVRDLRKNLNGDPADMEPVRFTGIGIVTLNGEYGITLDIDPATLDMPPTVANGRRFKVTFVEVTNG